MLLANNSVDCNDIIRVHAILYLVNRQFRITDEILCYRRISYVFMLYCCRHYTVDVPIVHSVSFV